MVFETKTDRLPTLLRKLQEDDLEAQVVALKELQRQPGFKANKTIPAKKNDGIFAALRKQILRLKDFCVGSKMG